MYSSDKLLAIRARATKYYKYLEICIGDFKDGREALESLDKAENCYRTHGEPRRAGEQRPRRQAGAPVSWRSEELTQYFRTKTSHG